jgi:hypothetical protein
VDVDFVMHPQPTPECPKCRAAERLRRWLPLLRLTPHLALVLPAFDARAAPTTAARRLHTKAQLGSQVRAGLAESFAFQQYPMGHACDNASRWLRSTRPFAMKYQFGCEPYLIYNRRAAPKLWEMFVAYGKDRVSFTYELAARGFVMVVQPDVFVVHHTTVARGAAKYGHAPDDWMVGETCWPDFENRMHLKYGFREGWCAQTSIIASVNRSVVNGSIMCVAQLEALCVLNCRPTVVRWQGQRAHALRRRAALALAARNVSAMAERRLSATSEASGPVGAGGKGRFAGGSVASGPLRIEGTLVRPPKQANPFVYPLRKRDHDRKECCRAQPRESRCDSGS